MCFQKLLIFVLVIYLTTCYQNQYILVPHHCEVTNINYSMFNYFNYKCEKRSRTELYLNLNCSYIMDINSDSTEQVKITGYVFRSNEYRKGPIEFMLGMCSALTTKEFDVPHLMSQSNLRCPIKKNTNYYINKLSPNATNMPPLVPSGDWMLEFAFMYLNKYVVYKIKWYTQVAYPIFAQ